MIYSYPRGQVREALREIAGARPELGPVELVDGVHPQTLELAEAYHTTPAVVESIATLLDECIQPIPVPEEQQ